MAHDPADRFASAGELMVALRDGLDGADRDERGRSIVARAHREHLPTIQRLRDEARKKRSALNDAPGLEEAHAT